MQFIFILALCKIVSLDKSYFSGTFFLVPLPVKPKGTLGLHLVFCTYPVIPSFVHVCIYFWFPLWLFLELDSLLWNIVLEVSGPFYNLITRNYATDFNMNFLEVSLLL